MDAAREWRGGQQQLAYLVRGMEALGHRVWVAAPADGCYAQRGPGELLTIPAGAHPLAPLVLRRWVKRLRPQVVAAHTPHAHGICVAAGLAPVVHRRVDFPLRPSPLTRLKYARGALYVAVSAAVAEVLVAGGVPRKKIRVVHDGVEPLAAQAPAVDLGPRPLLGAVGALVAHKGHCFLVEAMAQLPGVHCVIAGEGPLRASLQAQIQRLGLGGRVTLLGQRADVSAIFAALDLFVHPSVEEGMGQVVVEAMAARVPVLVTRAGGLPEVVGPGAQVVTPGDCLALASAIRAALAHPPEVEPAARRAQELFSVERMVEATVRVYQEQVSRA